MTTLFDNTDVTVEMAFGDQPLDTSPTWVDVSAYVRRVNINRGRSSELTRYSAGSARLELDNRDRRFDPEHSSSPYVNDLVPMVPVRVTAQYSTGTTNTIFTGFVLGWPTTYNLSNTDAITTVQCVDGTRILANSVLPQSSYISEVLNPSYSFFSNAPRYYWPLQTSEYVHYDEVGDVPLEFDSAVATDTYTVKQLDRPLDAPFAFNGVGLSNATEVVDWPIKGISFYTDKTAGYGGSVNFHKDSGNHFKVICSFTANKISVAYYNNDGNEYLAPSSGFFKEYSFSGWRDTANRIDVLVDSGFMEVYVNGASVGLTALTSGTATGGTYSKNIIVEGYIISHIAGYDDTSPLTGSGAAFLDGIADTSLDGQNAFNRLTHLIDRIGWPSAWFDIKGVGFGDQTLGSYLPKGRRANDYIETISNAEQGDIFVDRRNFLTLVVRNRATISIPEHFFSTEATDLPFQDVTVDGNSADAITNRVITRFATGERTVSNETSIDDFGLSTQIIDAELISDPTQAQQIAQRRLDLASTPRTRLTQLKVDVRSEPATLVDAMSTIDLATDVVVSFTPTDVGDDIWRSVRVQGISHDITPDSWTSSMYLAPGTTGENGPLFILNDTDYGELNDGNKLG